MLVRQFFNKLIGGALCNRHHRQFGKRSELRKQIPLLDDQNVIMIERRSRGLKMSRRNKRSRRVGDHNIHRTQRHRTAGPALVAVGIEIAKHLAAAFEHSGNFGRNGSFIPSGANRQRNRLADLHLHTGCKRSVIMDRGNQNLFTL